MSGGHGSGSLEFPVPSTQFAVEFAFDWVPGTRNWVLTRHSPAPIPTLQLTLSRSSITLASRGKEVIRWIVTADVVAR